jgi:hypothetical protein
MISTSKDPYVFVPIVVMSTSGMSATLYELRALEVSKILFVTLSGAGPPFARLYLIPKSFLGPFGACQPQLKRGGGNGNIPPAL